MSTRLFGKAKGASIAARDNCLRRGRPPTGRTGVVSPVDPEPAGVLLARLRLGPTRHVVPFPGARASCPHGQSRAFGPLRAGSPRSQESVAKTWLNCKDHGRSRCLARGSPLAISLLRPRRWTADSLVPTSSRCRRSRYRGCLPPSLQFLAGLDGYSVACSQISRMYPWQGGMDERRSCDFRLARDGAGRRGNSTRASRPLLSLY